MCDCGGDRVVVRLADFCQGKSLVSDKYPCGLTAEQFRKTQEWLSRYQNGGKNEWVKSLSNACEPANTLPDG